MNIDTIILIAKQCSIVQLSCSINKHILLYLRFQTLGLKI